MPNPWVELPTNPPYVLPGDRSSLTFAKGIQTDVLPVPFLGSPERARVYLLALNPGFGPTDLDVQEKNLRYAEQHRLSLTFRSDVPFWCLDPSLAGTPGYRWWAARLRQLAALVGWDILRQRLMCVQYFPYRSRTFEATMRVPSQNYSFELVSRAISSGKTIVLMRSRRLWEVAVPSLATYGYHELLNPRAPFVTDANTHPGDFAAIVHALTRA